LKVGVLRYLDQLTRLSPDKLVEQRQSRIAAFGVYAETK
jgi:hypothetical protein